MQRSSLQVHPTRTFVMRSTSAMVLLASLSTKLSGPPHQPQPQDGERAYQVAQTRVPAVRLQDRERQRSEDACARGAREAQRPRVPAVRRCVRGGEHSEEACAHCARAAQRPCVPAVRRCVRASGASEDACAHGAQAGAARATAHAAAHAAAAAWRRRTLDYSCTHGETTTATRMMHKRTTTRMELSKRR